LAPDMVLSRLAKILTGAAYLRCLPVLAAHLLLVPDSIHNTSSQAIVIRGVRRG
jgi:hypothetical protein